MGTKTPLTPAASKAHARLQKEQASFRDRIIKGVNAGFTAFDQRVTRELKQLSAMMGHSAAPAGGRKSRTKAVGKHAPAPAAGQTTATPQSKAKR